MPWVSKRVHPSIIRVSCDLTGRHEQWVLLRSDAHHDNPHSDHEKEKADLDEAMRRKAIILDLGDFFCAMGGKFDPRRTRKGVTRPEHCEADDYFDSLVRAGSKFLRPYAKNIAMMGQGNHETSVLKHNETDLTQRIIERINTHEGTRIEHGKYGGEIHFRLKYHQQQSSLWLNWGHGTGGGGIMSFGTLKVRREASWNPNADVIVSGHIHERWVLETTRKVVSCASGKYAVELKPQWHVRTGTYKEEYGLGQEGWHVERGAPPKPIGAMWMKLRIVQGSYMGTRRTNTVIEFTPT